jgi:hypothetical protein
MSNGVIAFLAALGATTWIYYNFYKPHTMDTKRSLTLAAITFVIIFFIVLTLAGFINQSA